YPPARLCSSLPQGPTPAWGQGLYGAAAPKPRCVEKESQGLTSSRATLVCLCRVLGPRRERTPMAVGRGAVAPASGNSEGSPRVWQSRGSIARPGHWLSTLRRGDHSPRRKTGFRPRARSTGWDWLPTGLLRKVSAMHPLHPFLLSRALLVAMPACHGRPRVARTSIRRKFLITKLVVACQSSACQRA